MSSGSPPGPAAATAAAAGAGASGSHPRDEQQQHRIVDPVAAAAAAAAAPAAAATATTTTANIIILHDFSSDATSLDLVPRPYANAPSTRTAALPAIVVLLMRTDLASPTDDAGLDAYMSRIESAALRARAASCEVRVVVRQRLGPDKGLRFAAGLARVLPFAKQVETIDAVNLSSNGAFTRSWSRALAAPSSALTHLHLVECYGMHDSVCDAFAAHLRQNTLLKSLRIADHEINPDGMGAGAIPDAVAVHPALEELELMFVPVTKFHLIAQCRTLRRVRIVYGMLEPEMDADAAGDDDAADADDEENPHHLPNEPAAIATLVELPLLTHLEVDGVPEDDVAHPRASLARLEAAVAHAPHCSCCLWRPKIRRWRRCSRA